MIVWAEDNKYKGQYDDYIIPPRVDVNGETNEWKNDFKFVTKLDGLLSDGLHLTKKELQMCNKLYEFYSKMYMKNILRSNFFSN